ncbi:CPBP family intramembrane glutamic endopeptidase [Methanobrevibacter sp.]
MESFNENLKQIRILEIIAMGILFIFLLGFFELDIEWFCVFLIAYVLFRCRKNLTGLKSCTTNLFSRISLKTWFLLAVTSYIFALGSGLLIDDALTAYGFYNILTYTTLIGYDLLFSVILGPIVEEILFRGILFNRFNIKLPMTIAILSSSLLFSLLHPNAAILSSFIFGITMCITYLLTENILVPITLHMLNNLISMIMGYIANIGSFFTGWAMIIIYCLTIISLIYILRFIIAGYRKIQEKY